jgi:hypothetical protein
MAQPKVGFPLTSYDPDLAAPGQPTKFAEGLQLARKGFPLQISGHKVFIQIVCGSSVQNIYGDPEPMAFVVKSAESAEGVGSASGSPAVGYAMAAMSLYTDLTNKLKLLYSMKPATLDGVTYEQAFLSETGNVLLGDELLHPLTIPRTFVFTTGSASATFFGYTALDLRAAENQTHPTTSLPFTDAQYIASKMFGAESYGVIELTIEPYSFSAHAEDDPGSKSGIKIDGWPPGSEALKSNYIAFTDPPPWGRLEDTFTVAAWNSSTYSPDQPGFVGETYFLSQVKQQVGADAIDVDDLAAKVVAIIDSPFP